MLIRSPELREMRADAGSPGVTGATGATASSRVELAVILTCLIVGSVLRLVWPADMEWKGDEQWMVTHAIDIARHGPLPWIGMPSGGGGPHHPALGVWLFAFFARWTESPIGLVQWVQWLNVAALWGWAAFAFRCVPRQRRATWLWGMAVFAVSPLPVLFARKIWIPDLIPIVAMPLLFAHHYRRTIAGGFAWGILGAALGQIHLSGFFFAFALVLVTVLRRDGREGMRPRQWGAWVVGSAIGAVPLVPWVLALRDGGTHAAQVGVAQLFSGRFFTGWVLNGWGLHVSYSARAFFHTFLTYPYVGGHPTYLIGVAHVLLAVIGVCSILGWVRRRFRFEASDPQLSLYLLAALVTGVLLTLTGVRVRAHYLVVLSPFVHVWVAALLRNRMRLLGVVVALQAAVSVAYLGTIHARGGIPEGDYGAAYRISVVQSSPAPVSARAP